jgi:hypothetical protein
MGFDNAESDIVAMFLVGESGTPALVLMRDPTTGELRKFVAVLDDGVTAEATADEEGRLGEFVLGEHRFVFTDYTATQVTATYYAPGGAVVSDLVELAGEPTSMGSEKPSAMAHAEASSSVLDELVDDALNWVADPSNTYLPLTILRSAGETVAEAFEEVRSGLNEVLDQGAQLQDVVQNALSCATATLAACGQQAVDQAETLIDELAVLDPAAETTAGFEVTETGVQPIQEEWEGLVTPEEISTNFVVIDVPCEKSVFAKLNPECPQYEPPPALEAFDMLLETPIDTPISRSLLGSSDATSYELVRLPSNGVVTLHDPATGSFTYEPQSGFSGGDSFSFIVLKGETRSSEGVVSIAVKADATPPGDSTGPAPTSTAECRAHWTPMLAGTWTVNRPAPSGYERKNWTYTLTQGASDQWKIVEAYEQKNIYGLPGEDLESYEFVRSAYIQYAKVNALPYACWFGLEFMLAGGSGGTIHVQSPGGVESTLTR